MQCSPGVLHCWFKLAGGPSRDTVRLNCMRVLVQEEWRSFESSRVHWTRERKALLVRTLHLRLSHICAGAS